MFYSFAITNFETTTRYTWWNTNRMLLLFPWISCGLIWQLMDWFQLGFAECGRLSKWMTQIPFELPEGVQIKGLNSVSFCLEFEVVVYDPQGTVGGGVFDQWSLNFSIKKSGNFEHERYKFRTREVEFRILVTCCTLFHLLLYLIFSNLITLDK